MMIYSVLETALISVIGIFSAYHVMKMLMPRTLNRARASFALRLDRGADATSWRSTLAGKVGEAVPQSACDAGCGSGCNGCSVAVANRKPVSAADQTVR